MILLQLLLAIVLFPWIAHQVLDCPPPDDRELLPRKRVEILAQENAYVLLADFVRVYRPLEELLGLNEYVDIQLFFEEPDEWEKPDLKRVPDVLQQNQRAFEVVQALIDRPRYQSPPVEHLESPVKHILSLRHVSDLLQLRTQYQLFLDRRDFALEDAFRITSLGHKVRSNAGSLVEHLMGNAIYCTGMDQLLRVVGDGPQDEEVLESILRRLTPLKPRSCDYVDALRHEYAAVLGTMQRMLEGKVPLENLKLGPMATRVVWRLCLKPNRTRKLFASRLRSLIAESAGPYDKTIASRLDSPREWKLQWGLLSGNPVGFVMFHLLMPTLEGSRERETHVRALYAGTRVLVAIKCHEARTASLPALLSDLVPTYFSEVPRDPYDGQPLRYSRDLKILYSVGEDLIEGHDGSGPFDRKEPTFQLD